MVFTSDLYIRMNCPHSESFEMHLPLPALAAPGWISGGVTVELNPVLGNVTRMTLNSMWCCTGIREQGHLALLHCSELLSLSGTPLSIKAR